MGTPIGNLEDMTYRAVRVLEQADLIAAEDTRAARVLLGRYDIHTPTLSFHEANERQRVEQLLRRLRDGDTIAVISQAGMPGISDPGFPLVRACIAEGIAVDVIPGPSAVTTALLLSGFAPASFRFCGFLPRRGAARNRALKAICEGPDAVVLFESPRRVQQTLADLAKLAPERPVALVREMTKLYQETRRGTASTLVEGLEQNPARGEITLVIGDAPVRTGPTPSELREEVQGRLEQGQSPKQIAETLAAAGCSKRSVYQLALSLRSGKQD